jgi:hypothetical protein
MKQMIVLILLFVHLTATAQDIKVKKGKVWIGDSAVALFDGKGGIFRTYDVTIASLQEKPLIKVKEFNYQSSSPLGGYFPYLQVDFMTDPPRQLLLSGKSGRPSDKKLAALFFGEDKNFMQGDSLLTSAIDAMQKNDGYDLAADTMVPFKRYEQLLAALKAPVLERDRNEELLLIPVENPNREANVQHFELIQQGILIGKLEQTYERNNMGGDVFRLLFYRKLETPFVLDGKEETFVLTAIFDNIKKSPECVTLKNKTVFRAMQVFPNLQTIQQEIREFCRLLILNGHL